MMQAINQEHDGRTDFDFFIGRWDVKHICLRERLKGCTEWDTFGGVSISHAVLGDLGNLDEVTIEKPTGRIVGITLRLYDPKARQWSLNWSDSVSGRLFTPMMGGFKNGLGEFFSQEVFESRHIFNRFIWSEITETSCHWEQAFSDDGGQHWETNWITEFTRQLES